MPRWGRPRSESRRREALAGSRPAGTATQREDDVNQPTVRERSTSSKSSARGRGPRRRRATSARPVHSWRLGQGVSSTSLISRGTGRAASGAALRLLGRRARRRRALGGPRRVGAGRSRGNGCHRRRASSEPEVGACCGARKVRRHARTGGRPSRGRTRSWPAATPAAPGPAGGRRASGPPPASPRRRRRPPGGGSR